MAKLTPMVFDFTILERRLDGIGLYSRKILDRLLNDPEMNSVHNTLIIRCGYPLDSECRQKRISRVHFFRFFNLGVIRALFSNDLYYSPSHHGAVFYKNKIITVHDIIPFLYPRKSFKQYIYYNIFLRFSVRFCKKIITVSNFTKDLLIKHYGISPSSIEVIYNGTDIDEIEPHEIEGFHESRFLLMVGANSEYKNYKKTIKALDTIPEAPKLVITTANQETIDCCGNRPNVKVLDYVTVNQIKWLYLNCAGLLCPSLMEGFGLPVLEAARLKKPVLTSENSPMSEFLGPGAAIYVNPCETHSIANGIRRLIFTDTSRQIQGAYANTKSFSWDETFKRIRQLL